jgi:hypothetical protein
MEITTIIAVASSLFAILFFIFSYFLVRLKKRAKEKEKHQQQEIFGDKMGLWANDYSNWITDIGQDWVFPAEQKETYWVDFTKNSLSNYEDYLRNLLVLSSSYLTKNEIEDEVNKKFDELKKRIEEVEKRFPKESTLEKIASVNDAILATNVETLSESLKRIEDKLLTKWDIAKITFQILGGLGILIGIIFGIINL